MTVISPTDVLSKLTTLEAWTHKAVYIGVPGLMISALILFHSIYFLLRDIVFYGRRGWFVDIKPPYGWEVFSTENYEGQAQIGIFRVAGRVFMVIINIIILYSLARLVGAHLHSIA